MPWTKVYIDKSDFQNTLAKDGLRGLSYREALREAQWQLLEADQRVFILGEGVDDPGGIFGSTLGLGEKFGKDRVMDIPVAENGLTGVAVGAGIAGMRPIFVHMRMDFLPMCLDQIINHAAKWHYMTGGKVNCPVVIRSIIGRGWGSAAQHSQALHGLFTHIPGLKVVMPATPYDAKGLLVSAVNDGNPVIFCEHRWVYDYIGYVPLELYEVPIGQGLLRRPGRDVTVVALSQMLYEAIKAAKVLESEGIDIEIIDPRSLKPLDEDLILNSVRKTGRLVIADVGCKTGSVAAEIVTRLVEKEPSLLKAPVQRVCLPDTPTPASPVLEEAYYPSKDQIISAVKETLRKDKVNLRLNKINNLDISIIMPALNEEENIVGAVKNTLETFDEYKINGEVIVVNDGSTDNTESLVKEIIENQPRVKMLKHAKPQGIGASFWDGVDSATASAVCMLPGDNENDPREIIRYFGLLKEVDIVIPFVFNKEARSCFRNMLSSLYRLIINSSFSTSFNYTNGNIMYRKSLLQELDFRCRNFFFQTDILVRLAKQGYLFAEVPYRVRKREKGTSKALTWRSLRTVIRSYLRLAKDIYCSAREKRRVFTIDSLSKKRFQV